tara:strand:- start:30792 stop:31577 length:786 start_codon:yes stop_codon:yes gene_type:complete
MIVRKISFLLAVFGLLISVQAQDEDADLVFEAAKAAFQSGDYDEAIKLLAPIAARDTADDESAQIARQYTASILHRRGWKSFQEGNIEEAVSDFDRELELEPEYAPSHWQRGIALYYAGKYQEGVDQFEIHKTVNPEDVENAVWHFLCAVRVPGGTVAKARENLIPISGDSRVPMKEVHQLFAGDATPESVIEAGKLGGNNGEFYAALYVGLYFEAVGETEKAMKYVREAAENASSNHYMGDVARTHLTVRNRERSDVESQ